MHLYNHPQHSLWQPTFNRDTTKYTLDTNQDKNICVVEMLPKTESGFNMKSKSTDCSCTVYIEGVP